MFRPSGHSSVDRRHLHVRSVDLNECNDQHYEHTSACALLMFLLVGDSDFMVWG